MKPIWQHNRLQQTIATLAVVLVAGAGVYFLAGSHAATPYATQEAESGTLGDSATSITDSAASGGSAVQFGQSSSNVSDAWEQAGLGAPDACPSGSVAISPGGVPSLAANTNYCFAAGTYTGTLNVQNGDGLYGGGHAILNGNNSTAIAVRGAPSNATVDGFTIKNYSEADQDSQPGVISYTGGSNDVITDNTVGPDADAGISDGGSCSTYNQQGGNTTINHNYIFNQGGSGISTDCQTNVTVDYNLVENNNTWNLNPEADVHEVGKCAYGEEITFYGNSITGGNDHGIWCDVYGAGVTIEGNKITNVQRSCILYEISFNAVIDDNLLENCGAGTYNDSGGSPGAGVSISSSGAANGPGVFTSNGSGYFNQPGPESITISGNTMVDNWQGVALFDGHLAGNGQACTGKDQNIHVSDNNITVDGTSTNNYASADTTGDQNGGTCYGVDNSFSDDHYTISKDIFGIYAPVLNWAGWQSTFRYDTTASGATCKMANGSSCQ